MKDEQFDLVLTGLQSDDQGFAQTGVDPGRAARPAARDDHHGSAGRRRPALARQARARGRLVPVGRACRCRRVLTIQSGINQLRYATLKGIMAAKKKEIRKVGAAGAACARAEDRRPLRAGEEQEDADDRAARRPRRRRSSCAGCAKSASRSGEGDSMILVDRANSSGRQAEPRDVGNDRGGAAAGGSGRHRPIAIVVLGRERRRGRRRAGGGRGARKSSTVEHRGARAVHARRLRGGAASR